MRKLLGWFKWLSHSAELSLVNRLLLDIPELIHRTRWLAITFPVIYNLGP